MVCASQRGVTADMRANDPLLASVRTRRPLNVYTFCGHDKGHPDFNPRPRPSGLGAAVAGRAAFAISKRTYPLPLTLICSFDETSATTSQRSDVVRQFQLNSKCFEMDQPNRACPIRSSICGFGLPVESRLMTAAQCVWSL